MRDPMGWGKDWASSRNAGARDPEDKTVTLILIVVGAATIATKILGHLWDWW